MKQLIQHLSFRLDMNNTRDIKIKEKLKYMKQSINLSFNKIIKRAIEELEYEDM